MIKTLYEKFQHWSDGGSVYLISDPHFGPDNECLQMNPNYLSAAYPDEYVNLLNKQIHKNDTLICLGDCGNVEHFRKLKAGYKVLIKGNHDDKGTNYYKPYFDEVYDGPLFISDQILLSHEPIDGLKFCINICGHMHNFYTSEKYIDGFGGTHLCIAADVCNFTTLNLGKEIKKGLLSNIDTIHRITIDKAIYNKYGEKIN